jgi:hypothetical protein
MATQVTLTNISGKAVPIAGRVLAPGAAVTVDYLGREARKAVTAGLLLSSVTYASDGNNMVVLTDNSGGTASDTIAAQTGAYVQATQQNTIASLAGKINTIIAFVHTLNDQMNEIQAKVFGSASDTL